MILRFKVNKVTNLHVQDRPLFSEKHPEGMACERPREILDDGETPATILHHAEARPCLRVKTEG